MNWIMLVVAFILGAISMFMMVCIGYAAKQEEPVNRVHFYVARDKDKTLWLYIGRPIKDEVFKSFTFNERGGVIMSWNWFERLGLNRDDYKDLKWEDGPKEVFLNLEE